LAKAVLQAEFSYDYPSIHDILEYTYNYITICLNSKITLRGQRDSIKDFLSATDQKHADDLNRKEASAKVRLPKVMLDQ
jgi:hypothetical protein